VSLHLWIYVDDEDVTKCFLNVFGLSPGCFKNFMVKTFPSIRNVIFDVP
jgi:hypothetical protein